MTYFNSTFLRPTYLTGSDILVRVSSVETAFQLDITEGCLEERCLVTDQRLIDLTYNRCFTLIAHMLVKVEGVYREIFCSAMRLLEIFDYENKNPEVRRRAFVANIQWVVLERDDKRYTTYAYNLCGTSRIRNVDAFRPALLERFNNIQNALLRP